MSQDLSLISRQLKRETQQHEEAAKRLRDRTREAHDRSYASSTVYGRKAVKALLAPVSERIKERMFTLRRGAGAVDAVEVYKHLQNADPAVLALITVKTVLDVLGKEPEPLFQQLTTQVGKNVQLELRMGYYFEQHPDLYKRTEFFFHKGTGTQQKATVFRRAFNKHEIHWDRWPNAANHKVGSWLIVAMAEVTGWLQRKTVQAGNKRKRTIRYTPEFLQHRDTIMAAAESMAFCQWPMVCPPVDWSNDHAGGYLTESVRQANPLIRKAGPLASIKQGDIPLAMLNNLQQVAYRINPFVFMVAEHCYEHKISVGKFRCDPPMPVPENLLPEDAPDEDVLAYKRARTEAENHNAQLSQKNWRTTETLYVARKYKDENKFWNCASFDYRGRVYFQNTVLNPQGTDFDKSLLLFADEGPVNEKWLAIHTATCFGLDKATMDERIEWTRANTSLISAVANEPFDNHEWREAAEPWCFLAACWEYFHCCIDATKPTSGLPCGVDATASGIQHLAALTACAESAALCNVLPTEKPADAYATVANKAKDFLPKRLHEWLNRKLTKRTVMTTPYGVQESSARNYIRMALKEAGWTYDADDMKAFVKAIYRQAVPAVFPGPVAVMKWLQQSALEILDRGDEVITWTSPSGFVIRQDLREIKSVRIDTRLMGGARMNCVVADGYGDPDRAHHRSALAPNVIHSFDAALIHLTFYTWEHPFTVIHDCVLGRSCDMEQMSVWVRHYFAWMYEQPVMQQWANEVGVTLPSDLIRNTLDIEQVNQSIYFFC